MHYHFVAPQPTDHYLHVTLTLHHVREKRLYLQLPAWRPGRYELGHFARLIRHLAVTSETGQPLPCQKVTKDRWEVRPGAHPTVVVRYEYYADRLDGGYTYVDEQQLYLNFITCALYAEGRLDQPCTVTLDVPPNYRVACGLTATDARTFAAPDYYRLVDSPLVASPTLQHRSYEVEDTTFHIWLQGDFTPDWERWLMDFTLFTEVQIQTFGEFPAADYHFIGQLPPYAHFHGVEHFNSTMVVFGPAPALAQPEAYRQWLGLCSHELFHTWNVIRMRPAELSPYDFTRENYFRTGFVAEGLTTYYGDLMLARAGLLDTEQYADELTQLLRRHFGNPGRLNQPVAEASWDLWLDGYAPGIPGRKTSIYTEGAVAALLLDLTLRQASDHAHTLDHVLRQLWDEFGHSPTGYTLADYVRVVEQVAGRKMKAYFASCVTGATDLTDALRDLLAWVGMRLIFEPAATAWEHYLGLRLDAQRRITHLDPNAPATRCLSLGDELVAVAGYRLVPDQTAYLQRAAATSDAVEVVLFRRERLCQLRLPLGKGTYFRQATLVPDQEATEAAQANRQKWLGRG